MEFNGVMKRVPLPLKTLKAVGALIGVAILLLAVGALFIWVSGGSAQPSAGISAPGLQVSGSARLFHIDKARSQVRFVITETLLGQPKTVIGSTNEVAGGIAVDFDNPANSQIGTVRINVRTLQTDNEIRNRTLRGQILQANRPEFEFATFVPRRIVGLPDSLVEGQPLTLQIVGDLTVHGATRSVTFDATVTPVNRNRIEGRARATVQYQAFHITVPDAPGVANVAQTVVLEIDLVAVADTAHESG
jgi:polyisoprenoid-binding protein YceI